MATETQHAIDTMLLEERTYPPPPEFARQANAQPDIYERDWEEFWDTEGKSRVTWFEPFSKLHEWEPPYAKWYLGGKLNVSFNCVDRHVEAGSGGRVAYYWEGEPEGERREITYADLQQEVVRFANVLKELGVGKRTADEAMSDAPGIKKCLVVRRTANEVAMQAGRDVWYHELAAEASDDPQSCPCEPMDAEDLLFLMYTSGTTAKPKGIVHTTGG